jgi:hypothetical protein
VKKILIGCLVIAVLGMAVLAVGGYFVYRAASPIVQNARNYLDQFKQLGELERNVQNQSPYTAPGNGELTAEQMERFARVQQHVRGTLGQRFEAIEAKYKQLKFNNESGAERQASFRDVMSALGDLAGVVVDARRIQIDALNQERFSPAEYDWVRARVYEAAGVEATSTIDLHKIAEAARRGTGIDFDDPPKLPTAKIPPKNRELVKPYLKDMDQWLPLLFFGL